MEIFALNIDDIDIGEVNSLAHENNFFSFIVTPNIQHVIDVNANKDLLRCYRKAKLTLCDSRVIQLISRLLRKPINNVVPGSDLTKYYFEHVFKGSEKIMIIGSSKQDIQYLRKKYELTELLHYNPPMGFIDQPDEVEKTIAHIIAAAPRYLFLAVGFPRQEMLACKLNDVIDFKSTAFCIGASIDFLTGKQKRAPQFWQKMKLEWLYRFLQSPRRLFRRYFLDGWKILPLIFHEIKKSV